MQRRWEKNQRCITTDNINEGQLLGTGHSISANRKGAESIARHSPPYINDHSGKGDYSTDVVRGETGSELFLDSFNADP